MTLQGYANLNFFELKKSGYKKNDIFLEAIRRYAKGDMRTSDIRRLLFGQMGGIEYLTFLRYDNEVISRVIDLIMPLDNPNLRNIVFCELLSCIGGNGVSSWRGVGPDRDDNFNALAEDLSIRFQKGSNKIIENRILFHLFLFYLSNPFDCSYNQDYCFQVEAKTFDIAATVFSIPDANDALYRSDTSYANNKTPEFVKQLELKLLTAYEEFKREEISVSSEVTLSSLIDNFGINSKKLKNTSNKPLREKAGCSMSLCVVA